MATRINKKTNLIEASNSIKKSNALSLGKWNEGLTLNQMQLLAYFIYCTQQNDTTSFNKADFEHRFNLGEYRTNYAKEDVKKLSTLQISTSGDEEFGFWNIFEYITYKNGLFSFKWTPRFLPHILDLKEKYIVNNLTMTANFRSAYSWLLYEHLKGHFNYFHKVYTKDELLELFNVENMKTYKTNTGRFKQSVLEVAINEINEYTELHVDYKEIKEGRKLIAFDLHWSIGKQVYAAPPTLIEEIKALIAVIEDCSTDILAIPVEKAMQEANESFQLALSYKKEFEETKSLTKDEAEGLYRTLTNLFNLINRAIASPKSYKYIRYNWLDERDDN